MRHYTNHNLKKMLDGKQLVYQLKKILDETNHFKILNHTILNKSNMLTRIEINIDRYDKNNDSFTFYVVYSLNKYLVHNYKETSNNLSLDGYDNLPKGFYQKVRQEMIERFNLDITKGLNFKKETTHLEQIPTIILEMVAAYEYLYLQIEIYLKQKKKVR